MPLRDFVKFDTIYSLFITSMQNNFGGGKIDWALRFLKAQKAILERTKIELETAKANLANYRGSNPARLLGEVEACVENVEMHTEAYEARAKYMAENRKDLKL